MRRALAAALAVVLTGCGVAVPGQAGAGAGAIIVFDRDESSAEIFDADGTSRGTVEGPFDRALHAVAGNGRVLLGTGDGGLVVVDTAAGDVKPVRSDGEVPDDLTGRAPAVRHPVGDRYALLGNPRSDALVLVDVVEARATDLTTIEGIDGLILGAELASDEEHVVVVGRDATVLVPTDEPSAAVRLGDSGFADLSPDGQQVVVTQGDQLAQVFDVDDPDQPANEVGSEVVGAVFAGKRLVLTTADGTFLTEADGSNEERLGGEGARAFPVGDGVLLSVGENDQVDWVAVPAQGEDVELADLAGADALATDDDRFVVLATEEPNRLFVFDGESAEVSEIEGLPDLALDDFRRGRVVTGVLVVDRPGPPEEASSVVVDLESAEAQVVDGHRPAAVAPDGTAVVVARPDPDRPTLAVIEVGSDDPPEELADGIGAIWATAG